MAKHLSPRHPTDGRNRCRIRFRISPSDRDSLVSMGQTWRGQIIARWNSEPLPLRSYRNPALAAHPPEVAKRILLRFLEMYHYRARGGRYYLHHREVIRPVERYVSRRAGAAHLASRQRVLRTVAKALKELRKNPKFSVVMSIPVQYHEFREFQRLAAALEFEPGVLARLLVQADILAFELIRDWSK